MHRRKKDFITSTRHIAGYRKYILGALQWLGGSDSRYAACPPGIAFCPGAGNVEPSTATSAWQQILASARHLSRRLSVVEARVGAKILT
jgi:hypothetical protein